MPVAESAMVRVDASERLIFPLDVPSVESAREWVQRLDGVVSFFKIGMELCAASGMTLIPELLEKRKKIFLDLKYFDIPETVESAVRLVAELGVTFLTIHGNGKIIQAAVRGRGASGLKLLSVTVLTCLDDDDLKEMGFECSLRDLVLFRAQKALEAGCDGVISSPREAQSIHEMIAGHPSAAGGKFVVVTPGIRPQAASRDDHKRLSSPTDAIRSGADYLVVGRPIREAGNPAQAAREIVSEMQAAFDRR